MAVLFSRRRAALFVSTALLLLLSILTVALYSSILTFISNRVVEQSLVINFEDQSYPVLGVLPQNLDDASLKLALASSVISLVVSSACVIFAVLFWPDGKKTYLISPIESLTYALVLNAILSFAPMIYLQVAHLNSSKFDPNYRGLYGDYDKGTFDFESWACQISDYENTFPREECRNAIAGRVADILICIAAIAAAAIGAWALRGERGTIRRAENEKRKRREFWLGETELN